MYTSIKRTGKDEININENCFDIIRAICTFTVFFGHFITHFNVDSSSILFDIAYFIRGVPVFFLLSGIFIARSLERYNKKEFIVKRIFRIFPELWICVIINLIIILLTYDGAHSVKDIFIYLATQFTAFQFYTGGWLKGYGVGTPNGALWTITVDIQFYILAIFIAKYMKNKSMKSWFVLIGIFATINVVIANCSEVVPAIVWKIVQCNIVPFLYIFLIGMLIYYYRDAIIPKLVKFRWSLVSGFLIWQIVMPKKIIGLFDGVRYNLITTLLLICAVTAIGFSIKYRVKTDYSYSFYLYHMVVINLIYQSGLRFTGFTTFALFMILSIVAICGVAYVSKKIVSMKVGNILEAHLIKFFT